MAKTEKGIAKKARAHRIYKTREGATVPGVTSVLSVIAKPQLIRWANELGLQGIDSSAYVSEAAVIGSLAHSMIQEHLGGPEWDRGAYSPAQVDLAENAFISFLEWEKRTAKAMTTIHIELPLVSECNRYGGTIDWYGDIDGQKWLIDIKTSKDLYPEHVFQVAAYKELLVENGYDVEGVRLLRVGRSEDEGFDDHIIGGERLMLAAEVFLDALYLYRAMARYRKFKEAM